MSKGKRSERIKSPEYRIYIGKQLRQLRIEEGYTLNDVYDMTDIPINTLVGIEKGEVTNIDYYVEYAKAVKYPLATLRQAQIKMQPVKKLPKEQLNRIRLTKNIREQIILTGKLQVGKSSQQILTELENLKVIPENTVTTTEIAGVMRNLIADDVVIVDSKNGNKNNYVVKS